MFQRYFGLYPLEQRIQDKKRGVGVQKHPIVCTSFRSAAPTVCVSDVSAGYVLSAAMLGVLIFELVTNSKAQGSPFSFKASIIHWRGTVHANLAAASSKPYARTLLVCTHSNGRAIPSLHEERDRRPHHYASSL